MLSETLINKITSISEPELNKLYSEYIAGNNNHGEVQLVTHLFNTKIISTAEFKSIQAQEKIELTSIANVTDIAQFEIDQLQDGSDEEDEDYTILESIDRGAMGEILIARDNKLRRTVINSIDDLEVYPNKAVVNKILEGNSGTIAIQTRVEGKCWLITD